VSAFQPLHVADLNLAIGATLPDIDGPPACQTLLGIVRLHDVPIGYLEAPMTAGRCSGRDLTRAVLRDQEDMILRHLLTDALADGSFARATTPTDLFDVAHHWTDVLPSFTVAVCTRDRAADLARCLTALRGVDYPGLDIIVVDNAPASDESERLVRSGFPQVRYVRESQPGVSRARNRAIQEAHGSVLAFVDDDIVVDRGWARAVARVFTDSADVMAVTGLVAPYELETQAQLDFERHLGWARRFDRRWFRRRAGEAMGERLVNTGKVGTGANMAFRRTLFDEIGTFDSGLGTGTIARGGEDLDVFFRVLQNGHTIVYEPAAVARHRHRVDHATLQQQIGGWASGMTAYLVRSMLDNRQERRRLLGFTARLLFMYHPRRVAQSFVSGTLRPSLTMAEFFGAVAGLLRYRRTAAVTPEPVELGPSVPATLRRSSGSSRPELRRTRTLSLDLTQPLPAVLPGPDDSDRVRIDVRHGGRRIGAVDIWCGGHVVTRPRAADAIATVLWRQLLEPREMIRRALYTRCGAA